MRIRRHNTPPHTPEAPQSASEQDRKVAVTMAEHLWTKVRDNAAARPDMFKELKAIMHSDGSAEVASTSITRGGGLSVFPSENGNWYVQTMTYRPSFEMEGFGKTVCERTLYPLSGEEQVKSERWLALSTKQGMITDGHIASHERELTTHDAHLILQNISYILQAEQQTAA